MVFFVMSLASTFLVSCSSDGEYSFRSPDEYHKDRDGGGLWVDQNAVKCDGSLHALQTAFFFVILRIFQIHTSRL